MNDSVADGTLEFDTKIDAAGFEQGINGLKTSAQGTGNIIKGILGSQAIAQAAEAVVEFGKKSVNLASDLQEVQNVVDVTFKDSADAVNEFATKSAGAYGLTELQAKQFSGTMGAMLKSMGLTDAQVLDMSISMTELTGDMASFYNLDHATAFEKLRSGISGETEPLKQLGINLSVANLEAFALSEGIKTAYEDMTEAEKVTLRYNYIMKQTADAQGDFSRTQDSYANQMRTLENNIDSLAANIGSALLPALTSAVGWVNSLFAGPEKNETLAAVQETAGALETLTGSLDTIKQNYATESIKINADYEEAQELLDTLETLSSEDVLNLGTVNLSMGSTGENVSALQEQLTNLGYTITDENGVFGESTHAAVVQFQSDVGIATDGIVGMNTKAELLKNSGSDMQQTVQALVDLYPELQQYVGENGLLTIENDKVRELIDGYRELALTKAMESAMGDAQAAYLEASAQLKFLEQKKKAAQQELDGLNAQKQQRQEVFSTIFDLQHFLAPGQQADTQASLDAVQAYIDLYGELGDEVAAIMAEGNAYYDSFDLGTLFNLDGTLKSAEEIQASQEAIDTLHALMGALQDTSQEGAVALDGEIESAQSTLDAASQAVEEFGPQVETMYNDFLVWQSAIQEAMAELTGEAKTTGEESGQEAADGLESKTTEAENAGKAINNAAQRGLNYSPLSLPTPTIGVGVGVQSTRKHATGLERVPYDNYLARLHVGEAVLTAAEAQAWRSGEGGSSIDYAQLAAAVQEGFKGQPAPEVVLAVDGRMLAQATAAENRIAIAKYNRRIAQGRGK